METATHHLDLIEHATTGDIKQISAAADVTLAPQCALALGFIGTLLTQALRDNVIWSANCLINEDCTLAHRGGQHRAVL
ncbi:hypothetical protein ACVIJ6_001050 [Bradyrhizobium sp. USDA 4369]